jgi:itaconate CoA-transferase
LHKRFPKLIVCDISGYGEGGPYETKKAYDLLIQSESGFISVTGSPDAPAKAGCSIADIAAGSYAYSSILNALLLRHKTGLGSHLDVSMLESMVEWMSFPLYYAFEGQTPPPRAGAAHATIYPYGPFPVGDGSHVMLGLQNEREWQVFSEKVLKQPELAKDPRYDSTSKRVANRDGLRGLIVDAFAKMTIDQVIEALEKAQIANARVNEMKDVWAHPQLKARQRWTEVQTPVGALPALLPPATSSAFDARMDPIPDVGEHTLSILKSLGVSDEIIAKLEAAKAI